VSLWILKYCFYLFSMFIDVSTKKWYIPLPFLTGQQYCRNHYITIIVLVLQLHHVCNCNNNESLLLTPFQEQYYIQKTLLCTLGLVVHSVKNNTLCWMSFSRLFKWIGSTVFMLCCGSATRWRCGSGSLSGYVTCYLSFTAWFSHDFGLPLSWFNIR